MYYSNIVIENIILNKLTLYYYFYIKLYKLCLINK